jgi:hypothetical protein
MCKQTQALQCPHREANSGIRQSIMYKESNICAGEFPSCVKYENQRQPSIILSQWIRMQAYHHNSGNHFRWDDVEFARDKTKTSIRPLSAFFPLQESELGFDDSPAPSSKWWTLLPTARIIIIFLSRSCSCWAATQASSWWHPVEAAGACPLQESSKHRNALLPEERWLVVRL